MLFDRPASLPTATLRASSPIAALTSRVRGGWRWTRPRLVPLLVAGAGMLAVLGAAEYLTHLARYTPEAPFAAIVAAPVASDSAPVVQPLPSAPLRVVVLSGQ